MTNPARQAAERRTYHIPPKYCPYCKRMTATIVIRDASGTAEKCKECGAYK